MALAKTLRGGFANVEYALYSCATDKFRLDNKTIGNPPAANNSKMNHRMLLIPKLRAGNPLCSFQINNQAVNPSSAPSTSSTTELDKIDAQTTNRWVKSPLEGYANLMVLLEKDATEEFLSKFRKLFISVVEPEIPLWYVSEE